MGNIRKQIAVQSQCHSDIFTLSVRETMHPESTTHFRKMFPNTLMYDLNDVPLAGKPQLEQSGASSAKPFTGSWSMSSSANLSSVKSGGRANWFLP